MRITIRQLTSFLAVADFGSFSVASRHTGAAQPALSQAVKDLEDELGVRLFDRTTRRVEITDAGREFLASARKILEELQLAVDNVQDLANHRRGHVRIAAPPLLASLILPKAIQHFSKIHPAITVEISDVGTEQIVESIRAGRADCGLGTFAPSIEGIERLTLVRDSLMLFCDPASPFAVEDKVRWQDIARHPLITLTRESGIRLLVEVGFESNELPLQPAYEVQLVTTAIALVEAKLGVAVLPSYALAGAHSKKVTVKHLVKPSIARDVVAVHASGRSLSPATLAFINAVRVVTQRLVASEEQRYGQVG